MRKKASTAADLIIRKVRIPGGFVKGSPKAMNDYGTTDLKEDLMVTIMKELNEVTRATIAFREWAPIYEGILGVEWIGNLIGFAAGNGDFNPTAKRLFYIWYSLYSLKVLVMWRQAPTR